LLLTEFDLVILQTIDDLFECVAEVISLSNVLVIVAVDKVVNFVVYLSLISLGVGLRNWLFLNLLEFSNAALLLRSLLLFILRKNVGVWVLDSTNTQGSVITDHFRVVLRSLTDWMEIGLDLRPHLKFFFYDVD
jgi:hypothetical protein